MSRKGWSALNVCVVADAIARILYVNSAFPESTHDSTVWNRCALSRLFRTGEAIKGYQLLGDCGYANGGEITTPFRPTSVRGDNRKMRFNREYIHSRPVVERTVGLWKKRFTALASKFRVAPHFASKMVIATAVLHSIGYCLGVARFRRLGSYNGSSP
ncbi:hypothetical protein ANCCAN_22677 [Ancylostoma caninum]|uniref:DDE Tnp4 domain-containing protein n=1 Tax=Ancylostoma caninum TaxID=29170 RepID=A0A368FHC2_ANCCA|nr:hypothetical protein ANCCAN_22677 [Ancylostoma caninum]